MVISTRPSPRMAVASILAGDLGSVIDRDHRA
jgi:hypothetical protein